MDEISTQNPARFACRVCEQVAVVELDDGYVCETHATESMETIEIDLRAEEPSVTIVTKSSDARVAKPTALRLEQDEPLLSREFLAVIAVALVGFGFGLPYGSSISSLLLLPLVLVAVAASKPWVETQLAATRTTAALTVATLLAVGMGLVGHVRQPISATQAVEIATVLLLALLVIAGLVRWSDLLFRHRLLGAITVAGAVGAVGGIVILQSSGLNIDVYWMQEAAADALRSGSNPYSSIVVWNGNPFAPTDSIFTGYGYPPLSLMLYSASDWLTGDPRWLSVLSLMGVAFMLATPRQNTDRTVTSTLLFVALLFAALPSLAVVIMFGWIEPISLFFLAVAIRRWESHPLLSAIALGLAFATKQYFIVAIPLLFVLPDTFRWKRVAVVGGVVALVTLPFVLVDPVAYWDATMQPYLSGVPRLDGTNLAALGIVTPRWLATGVIITLGCWLGRSITRGSEFVNALAALLAASFLMGFQAFTNYWFLIAGMVLIGLGARFLEQSQEPQPDADGADIVLPAG